MQFVRVEGWQPAADAIASRLQRALTTGPTLWFVSGGSSIAATVHAMAALPEDLTEQLTVLLIDERYGLPGHHDSNYKQLLDAGFQHKQATFVPVLVEGLTLQETAHRYEEIVAHQLERASTVIGQLGIGSDGHIAGILPHSPAVTAHGLVTAYEAGPYERITTTFNVITRLSTDFSLVFGENKRTALHKLQAETVSLAEEPAQILKQVPDVYIYNDLIGGET
ncbi:MAG TPA: 6-phosphogluconolactonase [Candidatus Saccharimonadales bacterium]|nr:6-phosphogluconolactonase [Candidatus Saccharimonadales bacterium]